MTIDSVQTDEGKMQQSSNNNNQRKRHASQTADVRGIHGQKQKTPAQAEVPSKQQRPQVANDGWGELFKNKETFVEMHLC